jgi:hypothetical protein
VQGWDDKIVVLCPTGDSVEFKWTPIYDQTLQQKYGAKNIDVSWASIADGLVTVGNYAMDNGQFREWQTKVMMSACPALLNYNLDRLESEPSVLCSCVHRKYGWWKLVALSQVQDYS